MTELLSVADRLEIAEVLARYNRHLDNGRFDLIPELFTLDAQFAAMGQLVTGREAIAAFFPAPDGEVVHSMMHVLSNTVLEPLGDGAVEAASDFVVIRRGPDGAYGTEMAGRFNDVLRVEDGTWKLAKRSTAALKRSRG